MRRMCPSIRAAFNAEVARVSGGTLRCCAAKAFRTLISRSANRMWGDNSWWSRPSAAQFRYSSRQRSVLPSPDVFGSPFACGASGTGSDNPQRQAGRDHCQYRTQIQAQRGGAGLVGADDPQPPRIPDAKGDSGRFRPGFTAPPTRHACHPACGPGRGTRMAEGVTAVLSGRSMSRSYPLIPAQLRSRPTERTPIGPAPFS